MDQKNLPIQLLKESILALAYYEPTPDFYSKKSIGIAMNGKPLLSFGDSDDYESNNTVNRLLKCSDFINAVEYQFGNVILSKVEINNKSILERKLLGLRLSIQGVADIPNDLKVKDGILEAVFLIDPKSISSLALHCCIQTNIMKCFHPEAKRLSYNLEIKQKEGIIYS